MEFKQNLTFLIGAGASFHSIPVQSSLNARIRIFVNFLREYISKGSQKQEAQYIFGKFDNLIREIDKSTSLDAYAKELSDRRSIQELNHLKILLSSYLLFEQYPKPADITIDPDSDTQIKTTVDKRYRTFWGHLTNDKNKRIPTNTKIISWNYDLQFELSYSVHNECSLELACQELRILPSISPQDSEPSLIKLNGTAGLFSEGERITRIYDFQTEKFHENVDRLMTIIVAGFKGIYTIPFLKFGWEPDNNQAREKARNILEATTHLVIIGYSFPRFNKEIDKYILENAPRMEQVIYQIPRDDYSEFYENLVGINPNLSTICQHKGNTTVFHVPNNF